MRAQGSAWPTADLPIDTDTIAVTDPATGEAIGDPHRLGAGRRRGGPAAGNTVVFKPSERTSLSGERLVELMAGALPADVLVLLHGDERAGGRWPRIRASTSSCTRAAW